VTEPVNERVLRVLEDEPKPATLDDLLPVVQRIADALEAQVRPAVCGVKHGDSGPGCVLDDRHVGHHASGDGRLHWLDED
jgi:hypothetical protein